MHWTLLKRLVTTSKQTMARPADLIERPGARSAGVLCAFMLTLAACGPTSESGPGGVSDGEARALDEAAQKLDRQQQLPKDAVPPVDLPVVEQAPSDSPAPQVEPSQVTGDTSE